VVESGLGACDAALLDCLYEAPLEPKGWSVFARALERALEGGIVVLCMPAPGGEETAAVVAPSLDLPFVDAYRRSGHRCDPWLHEALTLGVGEVVVRGRRIGDQLLTETAFYREWMAPQGLLGDFLLGSVVERDPLRRLSALAVFTRCDTRPGRGATALLRRVVPHLRRALRVHYANARLATERGALAAALDRLPLGVILVDRHCRVHATNRCADRLLARRNGLALDREGLHAERPDDDARLRRLLADVFDASGPLEAGGALLLERSPGLKPLRASVSRAPAHEGHGGAAALAVLFVSDPEVEVELPAAAANRLHGLTSAESALVRELVNGRSLQDAAARLHITLGTARQRLVPIFEKTGTGRQPELVRLMLSGPESLGAGE
jgi:DNA-binding CsgD family transcriptional regulator